MALKTNQHAGGIDKAKRAILNSFVFRFDSKKKSCASVWLTSSTVMPEDFLEKYAQASKRSHNRRGSRSPEVCPQDKLAVLVVGKAADFDRLCHLRPGDTLDITIHASRSAEVSKRR